MLIGSRASATSAGLRRSGASFGRSGPSDTRSATRQPRPTAITIRFVRTSRSASPAGRGSPAPQLAFEPNGRPQLRSRQQRSEIPWTSQRDLQRSGGTTQSGSYIEPMADDIRREMSGTPDGRVRSARVRHGRRNGRPQRRHRKAFRLANLHPVRSMLNVRTKASHSLGLALCFILLGVSPVGAASGTISVSARESATLGTTVACQRASTNRAYQSIKTLESDRAAEVLALDTSFSGRVVRLLRGDLDTEADLVLSKADSEDLFAVVQRTETGLKLLETGLCSWVFTNSRGERAATDVTVVSRLTATTSQFLAEVSFPCTVAARVEVRYEPKHLLVHISDGSPTERYRGAATPAICPGDSAQLKIRLPKRIGKRNVVILSYLAART